MIETEMEALFITVIIVFREHLSLLLWLANNHDGLDVARIGTLVLVCGLRHDSAFL